MDKTAQRKEAKDPIRKEVSTQGNHNLSDKNETQRKKEKNQINLTTLTTSNRLD